MIILSGCLSGEVLNALANGQEERAREAARWYKEQFGDGHYFLEIQRHDLEGEPAFNEALMRLSRDGDREGLGPDAVSNRRHNERPLRPRENERRSARPM